MTTFLGFLFFSIDIGLALGVGLSQLILFSHSSAVSCSQVDWKLVDNELQIKDVGGIDLTEEQLSKFSGILLDKLGNQF